MTRNMTKYLLAWIMIILVGAYVVLQEPASERDWYGYACAMMLFPLVFIFMGVICGLFKIILLIIYLGFRYIFDSEGISRWWKRYGNFQGFKDIFVLENLSYFRIPKKEESFEDNIFVKRPHKTRTKEEYEKLKSEGKI